MKTHVANASTRVICLRIVPVTGSPIYLTQVPRPLTMSNGHIYLAGTGYEFTGYSSTTAMSPAMVDLEGIAGLAGIGFDTIASGVFDNARAYLFATSWKTPVEDEEPITASILGKTTLLDGRYKIEEMALVDALNQSVGATYTASCPKVFGSQTYAGCKIALAPLTVTGTITAVTSAAIVRDSGRTETADYFAYGTLQFTSGVNLGLKPMEVRRHESDGTLEVFEPFHYLPAIGDTYTLIPGCRKRLADCRDKWNNVINFGGFSYIPLGSQYAQVGNQ